MGYRSKYIHIVCFILMAGACHKQDIRLAEPNAELRSAIAFVHNNFAYSLFSAAIERAGMTAELDGPGPFTILAPTNAAFNQWGIYSLDDLNRHSPEFLRKLISLHVLNGKHFVEDIPMGTVDNLYYSMDGHKLFFSRIPVNNTWTWFYVNGVPVSTASGKTDIILRNGLLHETGGLLTGFDGTLADWLEQNGQYKIFVAGLKKFGLWPHLSDTTQSWTVLPPSDSAFTSNGITADAVAGLDGNTDGRRLFGVYLFPTRFFRSDLKFFTGRLVDMSPTNGGIHAGTPSAIYTPLVDDAGWSNGYIPAIGFNSTDPGIFFLSRTTPQGTITMTKWVSLPLSGGYSGVDKDILTRNGAVQEINQILLLPADVRN